ncbi:hypothetical protein TNCT_708151 [Trichonephila clavata]|uniref:Uncharacterized protein n=1 Tax=Trichonephila clavata TaxID=2740835 RepID=A0A8X6KFH5_TRICU|nr:hypothetical protein TNCT_708151 [Trichonephila clavata]
MQMNIDIAIGVHTMRASSALYRAPYKGKIERLIRIVFLIRHFGMRNLYASSKSTEIKRKSDSELEKERTLLFSKCAVAFQGMGDQNKAILKQVEYF